MIALLWVVAILAALVAAPFLVAALVAAVRARSGPVVALSAAGLAVFLGVAFGVPHPLGLLAAAVAAGLGGRHLLRSVTRNWQHGSESVKLSAAHLTLIAGSFVFLIPFAWLISTSLKPDDEMAVFPPRWIPTQQVESATIKNAEGLPAKLSRTKDGGALVAEVADLPTGEIEVVRLNGEGAQAVPAGGEQRATFARGDLEKVRRPDPRWENYSEALAFLPPETRFGAVFLGNTLFLTAMTVIGTLLSSSVVAFAFARLNWPGKNVWFAILLATMMVPGAVTMMPQFLIFRSLGWIDTLQPLWVPAFFGSAFNIFLLRQFFMTIPNELEDAAKIDGCGPVAIYWRIMLPLVKPALAAIAIMGTLGAWNNFQGPLIYLSSPEKMPLAYALQLYQTQHGGEPGLMMAASTLVILPIIVLFFFTQRYFIEGVSLTGLGGR